MTLSDDAYKSTFPFIGRNPSELDLQSSPHADVAKISYIFSNNTMILFIC